jgi:hypothetical protein
MAAVPFTIPLLKTELTTDPAVLGYAPFVTNKDDNGLSDLINASRGGGAFQVARDPIGGDELFAQVDPTDFSVLTTTQLAQLQVLLTLRRIDMRLPAMRTILAGVFPTGATTRAAITAFLTRNGSRAEVLWGPGKVVTTNEIDQALHS